LNVEISIQGGMQDVITNPAGSLLYVADLNPDNLDPSNAAPSTNMPRPLYANDIIYGGLGNDFIHGGAGDDAISGAEALATSWTNNYDQNGTQVGVTVRSDFSRPYNPGNVLGYSPTLTYQAQYNPNDPFTKILLGGQEWLLNFNQADGPLDGYWAPVGAMQKPTDGDDVIFGDLGNDWIVGGTGRDTMWGGWGNDYLNADDDMTTAGGANTTTDSSPSYEDFAYGGAGVDVLLANTGGDRLVDWSGEWNSYLTPFSPFGMATVSRNPSPQLRDLLVALAKSQGADQTLTSVHGGDPARNGEPFGELGLVYSADAAWGDQNGQPRDPQPGNSPGARDVLRTSGTLLLGTTVVSPATTGAAAPIGAATALAAPSSFVGIDPTTSAAAAINIANKTTYTIMLGGPAGSIATYSVTDGTRTVNGSVIVGTNGIVTVAVDVSSLADGTLTVTAPFVDVNGNRAAATTRTVVKDTVAPVVTSSLPAPPIGNNGWYDIGVKIAFTFGTGEGTVGAKLDGATTLTSGGLIDFDSLAAGAHSIVITSVDAVGNTTTQTVSFEVHATLAGLLAALNDGFGRGWISSATQSSISSNIQSAMKGNSAHTKLQWVASTVQQQSGISILSAYASLMLGWTNDLLLRV